jgi:hypothetical protein
LTGNSQAGWYVNPAAGGKLQYWDGLDWKPEIEAPRSNSRPPEAESTEETSRLAIASLVTAFFAPTIVPIILGHLARAEIKKSGGRKTGIGFANAGLAIGYVTTILLIIFLALLFSGVSDSSGFGNTSDFDCAAAEIYIVRGEASDVLKSNYLLNCT